MPRGKSDIIKNKYARRVLTYICRGDNYNTVLAEAMGVSEPTSWEQLQRLEDEGWVSRKKQPGSNRKVYSVNVMKLTSEFLRFLDEKPHNGREYVNRSLDGENVSEKEWNQRQDRSLPGTLNLKQKFDTAFEEPGKLEIIPDLLLFLLEREPPEEEKTIETFYTEIVFLMATWNWANATNQEDDYTEDEHTSGVLKNLDKLSSLDEAVVRYCITTTGFQRKVHLSLKFFDENYPGQVFPKM